jgi:undecaprenyl-diphosphatase
MLLAFGLLLGLAVLCGELLELAERPDGSTAIDSTITSWVVAHRTGGLTTVARVLSTIGSQTILLPLTAIVAVSLVGRRQFVPTGLLVVCWGGGLALYSLAKLFVQRHRPPTDIWLTKVEGTSFPSGHATQSLATFVALALVGAMLWPRSRVSALVVALALAAGVGWSRVYLGVHWTTDVAAGWVFAGVWVAIVFWLAVVARPTE